MIDKLEFVIALLEWARRIVADTRAMRQEVDALKRGLAAMCKSILLDGPSQPASQSAVRPTSVRRH